MVNIESCVAKRRLIWNITNITKETLVNGMIIESNEFEVSLESTNIKFGLYFRLKCENNNVKLSLKKIERKNVSSVKIRLEVLKFENANINDKKIARKSSFGFSSNSWCIDSIERILDQGYLHFNETLICIADVMIERFIIKEEWQEPNLHLLRLDKYLNSSEFSDYTCICSDNKIFYVHQVILAAHSKVFCSLFKSGMLETQSKTIKIEDIDSNTFAEMLRFIYTGRVENLKEMSSSLIYAAEKYKLDHLKKLCAASLIENITTDNVLDILILADRFNEKQLLCECLQIIIKNYNMIKDHQSWSKIGRELMKTVMDAIIECSNQTIQLTNIL